MSELFIRSARRSDASPFAQHLRRHLAESRAPYFFSPTETPRERTIEDAESWAIPPDETGWTRAFFLVDPGPYDLPGPPERIVGHVELHGARLLSQLHRASISTGLEAGFRSRGWGRRLMTAAVDFARDAGLSHLDLRAFHSNRPALALYESLGFQRIGVTSDAFRMSDGTRIDDVIMSLELDRSPKREGRGA